MLIRESVVMVADNTGAKKAKIIWVPGWSRKKVARIWDYVVVSIQTATPNGTVKKWQVMRALVVRTRKETPRKDWTYIRFGDNAIVLVDIDWKGELKMKWKRVFWPVAKEIRELWYKVISNNAEEVI